MNAVLQLFCVGIVTICLISYAIDALRSPRKSKPKFEQVSHVEIIGPVLFDQDTAA
jgi:hypothetical protein